ncbi:ribitol 2-dehydrogenase [Palleronia aestuarii]|uniref:Ribitol 2-dehydrogenase n=1 Tax=Palleronia aestuarii TaxID=568105 RepID=A0A2W7NKQ1_9RHOB|nr:SDR family oxidoreductase [Palleronia aestuarii]PZX13766.1 ribitol 2-dehydrogenase [Palleronia aestuarii]
MSDMFGGKTAAITGAASGIGRATTEALISHGARVVMIDRDEAAMARIVEAHGENAIPLKLDLLDPADCDGLLDAILGKVDALDIFHANAGTYIGGDLSDTDNATIDRMLNLNVNVVMKNVRTIMPHMIERKTGDIMVTASVAGHFPVPWEPVYSSSKWAITAFVQTMRRQLREHGIRVGQVSPGPVISALLDDWEPDRLQRAKDAGTLMEPTEVSDAVIYMLSRPRNITIRDMIVLPTAFDL